MSATTNLYYQSMAQGSFLFLIWKCAEDETSEKEYSKTEIYKLFS